LIGELEKHRFRSASASSGRRIGPEITTATLGVLRAAAKFWQIEFAFETRGRG